MLFISHTLVTLVFQIICLQQQVISASAWINWRLVGVEQLSQAGFIPCYGFAIEGEYMSGVIAFLFAHYTLKSTK